MNNFKDTSRWQYRACNSGLFALASVLFLFAQMITLFDLAYQDELEFYACQGNASRPSVLICGSLMVLVVAMKMLPEERRCLSQRLVLIRHGTEFAYFDCFYKLIFEKNKFQSFKVLALQLFHSFRVYGVVTFVYVAAIEQIMLFDTIIDYVINSVVVLLLADIDELAFQSISKLEISPENNERGHDYFGFHEHEYQHVDTNTSGNNYTCLNIKSDVGITAVKSKVEVEVEVAASTSALVVGQGRGRGRGQEDDREEDEYDSYYEPVRHSYIQHISSAKTLQEMTLMKLTSHEKNVFLTYDYIIMRLNMLSMIVPLTIGKITGYNCSIHSRFRVSEITMIMLMISRVLLNVYIDVRLVKHKFKGRFTVFRHMLWSLLEHGVPCALYLLLMYYVFIEKLKPGLSKSN